MRTKVVLVLVLLGFFILSLQNLAAAGLRVTPSKIDLDFSKAPVNIPIQVKNTGKEDLVVRAYISGLTKDKQGNWEFIGPQFRFYNLADYVKLSHNKSFILGAGDETVVKASFKKPFLHFEKLRSVVFFVFGEHSFKEKVKMMGKGIQPQVEFFGRLGVIAEET